MGWREESQGEGPLDDAAVAERWAELTAALGDLSVPDDDDDGGDDGGRPTTPAARPGAAPDAGAPRELPPQPGPDVRPLGPRDYEAPEDDEGFVPAEPEPLGTGDPVVTLGWVAAVGPLLLGLVLAVVWSPVPGWVFLALGASVLAGVAVLLWRMPSDRDGGTRDDGAVV